MCASLVNGTRLRAPLWRLRQARLPFRLRSTALGGIGMSTAAGRRERGGGDDVPPENPSSNPMVARIQALLAEDPRDGWELCWKEGFTPWDLRRPTPVVLHLLQTGTLPKGRVLVPGCGSGHDVVAMAGPEHYVVGLDLSEIAIKKAQELTSSLSNKNRFTFLAADFFHWQPTELFDLIFDYTFFCAIDPCMRLVWATKIRDILKPDGELITLMFPIGDYVGGPPYAVSVADYEKVLDPFGFKVISIVDNELAIEQRKGREKLGRWKRLTPSLL